MFLVAYFILTLKVHFPKKKDLCSDEFPIDYIPVASGEYKEWTCEDWAGIGTRNSKMSYCDKSWKDLDLGFKSTTECVSEYCKLSCGSCSKLSITILHRVQDS